MNFQHHKERALAVNREAAVAHLNSDWRITDQLAVELGNLADIVADLCDDLTPSEPTVLRRGCWLHNGDDRHPLWFQLMEQIDFSEQWWAVRFDRYGCASTGLVNIHAADYQRCTAPDWWTA